eukprot:1658613-Rhodomonas_salina.2
MRRTCSCACGRVHRQTRGRRSARERSVGAGEGGDLEVMYVLLAARGLVALLLQHLAQPVQLVPVLRAVRQRLPAPATHTLSLTFCVRQRETARARELDEAGAQRLRGRRTEAEQRARAGTDSLRAATLHTHLPPLLPFLPSPCPPPCLPPCLPCGSAARELCGPSGGGRPELEAELVDLVLHGARGALSLEVLGGAAHEARVQLVHLAGLAALEGSAAPAAAPPPPPGRPPPGSRRLLALTRPALLSLRSPASPDCQRRGQERRRAAAQLHAPWAQRRRKAKASSSEGDAARAISAPFLTREARQSPSGERDTRLCVLSLQRFRISGCWQAEEMRGWESRAGIE